MPLIEGYNWVWMHQGSHQEIGTGDAGSVAVTIKGSANPTRMA